MMEEEIVLTSIDYGRLAKDYRYFFGEKSRYQNEGDAAHARCCLWILQTIMHTIVQLGTKGQLTKAELQKIDSDSYRSTIHQIKIQ